MAQFIRYDYMGREMYDWNIEEYCGYKPISTFYTDFGIAEWFGEDSIRDTYERAVDGWKDSIEWMTEIVMVLNWKIWEHYYRGDEEIARLYDELWRDSQHEVHKMFAGNEKAMSYYYRIVD